MQHFVPEHLEIIRDASPLFYIHVKHVSAFSFFSVSLKAAETSRPFLTLLLYFEACLCDDDWNSRLERWTFSPQQLLTLYRHIEPKLFGLKLKTTELLPELFLLSVVNEMSLNYTSYGHVKKWWLCININVNAYVLFSP